MEAAVLMQRPSAVILRVIIFALFVVWLLAVTREIADRIDRIPNKKARHYE